MAVFLNLLLLQTAEHWDHSHNKIPLFSFHWLSIIFSPPLPHLWSETAAVGSLTAKKHPATSISVNLHCSVLEIPALISLSVISSSWINSQMPTLPVDWSECVRSSNMQWCWQMTFESDQCSTRTQPKHTHISIPGHNHEHWFGLRIENRKLESNFHILVQTIFSTISSISTCNQSV